MTFEVSCSTESGDAVHVWHDMVFTEKGTLNLVCTAEEDKADEWVPAFTTIRDSLRLDSAIAYRARALPGSQTIAKIHVSRVLLLPAIMVLFGIVRIVTR